MVDVDQEHAERLVLFHRRDLRGAEKLIERAAVRQVGQRVGPGALFGLIEGVADGVEFARLLGEIRLELRGAGGGFRQLVHQAFDQQFRIGPGFAAIGNLAHGLDLRPVVVDCHSQELPGRGHHRMKLLRSLVSRRFIGAS
jgi:hypothetical protein